MLRHFLNPVVYVKLQPDLMTVRDVNSGVELTEPPLLALVRQPRVHVLGIGHEASAAAVSTGVELVNPFKHPRTLFSDFTVAEKLLKQFLLKVFKNAGNWILRPSPTIVLHPLVDPEGGFTQIELRAMQELGLGAGARKVYIWQGRLLADDELKELKFGDGGRLLS